MTTEPGFVLRLEAAAIHSIENPLESTGSALHLYGGDFRAVMDHRHLWTTRDFEALPFSFPALLRESVIAMKLAGNTVGLEAVVKAIPATKEMVEAER